MTHWPTIYACAIPGYYLFIQGLYIKGLIITAFMILASRSGLIAFSCPSIFFAI